VNTLPHLHFNGNCAEAFAFYAHTLGGTVAFQMKYGEAPPGSPVPPESREQIMHARVEFGPQGLTGCDVPHGQYQRPQGFNVIAEVNEPADAERIFAALATDGKVTMPCTETFWARRFGICTDRFGTPWMVNCVKPVDSVQRPAQGG
jgi:PhnB protein